MKSSKRKNVSKSSTPETKDCSDCITVGAALITVAIVALVIGAIYYIRSPKFEEGDCLLNRVGETLEVRVVDTIADVYELNPQKYIEGYSNYVAVRDYDKYTIEKDIEFVDEKYVQVPCIR